MGGVFVSSRTPESRYGGERGRPERAPSAAQTEYRMNPFSASRRFTPRFRGVSFVLLLLATLVCAGATETPSASGPNLTAGLTLERELKGGETHVYPVDLQAEQFLRVQVQEEGIDVEVRLLDPQGAVATGADSLSIGPPRSLEDLAVLTDTPGQYRLEVSS